MNLAEVLAAARRSQAAYIDDTNSVMGAFQVLGYQFIGQYQDGSHQAVLSRGDDGRVYLSISGTRFSQRKIGDVLSDLDTKPFNVADGAMVTLGAYSGLQDMWDWAHGLTPAGTVFTIDGHSLGGWRASYSPLFIPASQIAGIYTFESPKGGNAALWEMIGPQLSSLVQVINGRDLWASWPFIGDWCRPPRDTIWLQETGFSVIQPKDWPGGRTPVDHDIDLVVRRLEALA